MEEMLAYILIVIIVAGVILVLTQSPITKKKTLNEKASSFEQKKIQRTRENKEAQKLLRFKRGNKALTPEQQKLLFDLNQKNLSILKTAWKHEHL